MTVLRTAQVSVTPDLIDFGIGQPGFDLLPFDFMRRATEHRLDQGVPDMLNYGAEQGDGFFRQALSNFLSRHYSEIVTPEQLFITCGASQGLDLLCTLFTKPGDTIFVEEPSYFLALRIFTDHDLNVVGIPCDEDGMDTVALADELQRHRPVFVYTIPTFQNPTGVTMPAERRDRLVAQSCEYDFLIVADEVYHLLDYSAVPPQPFAHYVNHSPEQSGGVVSIGSFSKILAPGLRLGWLQASPAIVERFVRCGMVDSGGGLNPFTSSIVRSVLELGFQDTYLAQLRSIYTQRVDALDRALQAKLSDVVRYRKPEGGFFFWLYLLDGQDAQQLSAVARQHHVSFQPGVRFSSHGALTDCLRLSFAFYNVDELTTGVGRLAEAVSNRNL